jgi:hypothetical protein
MWVRGGIGWGFGVVGGGDRKMSRGLFVEINFSSSLGNKVSLRTCAQNIRTLYDPDVVDLFVIYSKLEGFFVKCSNPRLRATYPSELSLASKGQ